MRILFYIHAMAGGGAERVCNTLANEFSRHGKEVYVSTNLERPINYTFDKSVTLLNHWDGCRTTKFWSRFKLYRLLRTLFNMRQYAKSVRPDFVIGVMTDYSVLSILALAGLNIPIIATEHTNVDRMSTFYKRIYKLFYSRAAAVTVLTRRDLGIWKHQFNNVVCMPNPLSIPIVSKNYEKKKWVLGVGRVDSPEKGFDSMVKCWNKIYKKHPDWKLVIAGRCEEDDILKLCRLLDDGKDSNVEFLGFRSDVYDLMLQSEVFVLSSRYEGLPMGLMEAMSAGCCCVAFDVVTGPRDIIRDNHSGILVENQNIDKLAIALENVMGNDELRSRLAAEAPHSVTKFSKDRILNRWDILFDQIGKRSKNYKQ